MPHNYNEDAPLPPVENPPVGLRNAALAYASMGIAILPIRPGTKKANPEELGGVGYRVSDAGITNLDRINDIWTRNPGTGIGFVTGAPNGFMVIDIDRKRGGPDPIKALRAVERELGIEIPVGPTATTPNEEAGKEGLHIYLALPEGIEPLRCVRSWLPNVDIQCDGGYVIAPPSIRAFTTRNRYGDQTVTGYGQYEWQDMAGSPYFPTPAEWLTDLEAAVAPAALIEDIRFHGNRRSRPAELKEATGDARGLGKGLAGADWFHKNGIPDGLAQWDVLYFDMTWPLMNAGAKPEQIVAILRETVDHPGTRLVRAWKPWETGEEKDGTFGQSLWAIVNRAFERKQMDGDAYSQTKRDRELHAKYGDLHNISLFRKSDTKGTAK